MTDRPILFSAPMVRALLDGRKTQTRRIINIKPTGEIIDFIKVGTDQSGRPVYEMKGKDGQQIHISQGKHLQTPHFSPRFGVGDRLYVREHWRTSGSLDDLAPRDIPSTALVLYQADAEPSTVAGRHRQAMHMPRWASRLTLIVTDVRVQRLQDLSVENAIAEGLLTETEPLADDWRVLHTSYRGAANLELRSDPVDAYADLWMDINGEDAWDANPWIVAITFEVIKQNIDEVF